MVKDQAASLIEAALLACLVIPHGSLPLCSSLITWVVLQHYVLHILGGEQAVGGLDDGRLKALNINLPGESATHGMSDSHLLYAERLRPGRLMHCPQQYLKPCKQLRQATGSAP
jgi:hypothetical protein